MGREIGIETDLESATRLAEIVMLCHIIVMRRGTLVVGRLILRIHPIHTHIHRSLPLAHLPHHVPSQSQSTQPHHPKSHPHHMQLQYSRHSSQSHGHAPPPPPPPPTLHTAHLSNHLPPPSGAFRLGRGLHSPHLDNSQHTTIHFSSPSLPVADNRIKRHASDGGMTVKPFVKGPSSRSGPKVVACNYCRGMLALSP
jgi:hypothetical protein